MRKLPLHKILLIYHFLESLKILWSDISMMSHVHCQAPGNSNIETLFYMGIRMFSTK